MSETSMWQAVVHQAMVDALETAPAASLLTSIREVAEAVDWFITDDQDFREACYLAGTPPEAVRSTVLQQMPNRCRSLRAMCRALYHKRRQAEAKMAERFPSEARPGTYVLGRPLVKGDSVAEHVRKVYRQHVRNYIELIRFIEARLAGRACVFKEKEENMPDPIIIHEYRKVWSCDGVETYKVKEEYTPEEYAECYTEMERALLDQGEKVLSTNAEHSLYAVVTHRRDKKQCAMQASS